MGGMCGCATIICSVYDVMHVNCSCIEGVAVTVTVPATT